MHDATASANAGNTAVAHQVVHLAPPTLIPLTRFTNYEGPLTKRYSLKDGALTKVTHATLSNGRAERLEVTGALELKALLAELQPNQAIGFGLAELSDVRVVSKAKLAASPGAISRTQENFAYPKGPGILYLDGDADHFKSPIDSPDEYWLEIVQAIPELLGAPMVITASASSNIYTDNGECLVGARGYHAYVIVADSTDSPRAGAAMYERMWAQGLGRYDVSESGSLLDRNLIDKSVWQAQRLDFAAGAMCDPPLEQRRPEASVFNPAAPPFNTRTILDPTSEERESATAARAASRASLASEVVRAKGEYIEVSAQKMASSNNVPIERARVVVTEALERRLLFAEVMLYPQTGEPFTVAQALDDPARYHGRYCKDPIEPSYRNGLHVAWLNLRSGGRPSLYSHAHGGRRFELMRQPALLKIQPGEEPRLADDALAIIRERGDVFEFGTTMARISDAKPTLLDADYLADYLGRCIRFERYSEVKQMWRPAATPPILVKTVLARTGERALPQLKGIITAPTLRRDGSILDQAGYDAATELIYLNEDRNTARVPLAPSLDEVQAAAAELWKPFEYFPFDGELSRAVVLSAVLTAILRPGLRTAPGFGFDAPDKGSGKTLLARALGALSGVEATISTPPNGDEEQRKVLFASIRGGARVIVWDNMITALDGAAINAFLSAPEFSDRVLGVSRIETYPNKALFLVTGNNLRIEGDACRRILVARIDPQTETPFLRAFTFDPVQMIATRRLRLVVAGLTIVRGYITHQPAPVAAGATASFEEWDRLVRQPVAWLATLGLGFTDPCEALRQQVGDDPKHGVLGQMLRGWYQVFGSRPQYVRDVWAMYDTQLDAREGDLERAIADIAADAPKGFNAMRLGNWIKERRGRVVDGLRFSAITDKKTKINRWWVDTT